MTALRERTIDALKIGVDPATALLFDWLIADFQSEIELGSNPDAWRQKRIDELEKEVADVRAINADMEAEYQKLATDREEARNESDDLKADCQKSHTFIGDVAQKLGMNLPFLRDESFYGGIIQTIERHVQTIDDLCVERDRLTTELSEAKRENLDLLADVLRPIEPVTERIAKTPEPPQGVNRPTESNGHIDVSKYKGLKPWSLDCTPHEAIAIVRLLVEGCGQSQITNQTGSSAETIAKVRTSLQNWVSGAKDLRGSKREEYLQGALDRFLARQVLAEQNQGAAS